MADIGGSLVQLMAETGRYHKINDLSYKRVDCLQIGNPNTCLTLQVKSKCNLLVLA